MVKVIKFLLPLVTVLSFTQAVNTDKYNADDLLENIYVPSKYVIQDIELARNNRSATYEDYASLKYMSDEAKKILNTSDNISEEKDNNIIEKRGICGKLAKINILAFIMCVAGKYDMGCLLDGGQKLDKAWGCCSADCMKEPSEYCRASCFSTKGARPHCMGC